MRHLATALRGCAGPLVALAVLLGSSSAALAYPDPGGKFDGVIHDPSMLIRSSAPRYVAYGTNNISIESQLRTEFVDSGPYFLDTPAWWLPYIQADEANGDDGDVFPWAPDVSYHDGTYWMYYVVNVKGTETAAIGLATSTTGLPGDWIDQGPVITSAPGDAAHALDPNLLVDASGNWWLVFGSFYHGIYMTALDPSTGKLASPGSPVLYHLAEHRTTPYTWWQDDIEAPFIYQQGSYYYLFASAGLCCRGTSSTYYVVVGRSSSPTGPYIDESGTDMLQGGGTTILASHGSVIGPGGQSVYWDDLDDHYLLVYHYYDADRGGLPTFGINWLDFSSGWPVVF